MKTLTDAEADFVSEPQKTAAAGLPGSLDQMQPSKPPGQPGYPRADRRVVPIRADPVQDDETRNPSTTDLARPESDGHGSTARLSQDEIEETLKKYTFMLEAEIHSLYVLFQEWDSDQDGELTIADMKRMIDIVREAQINELFEKIDSDNSGLLDRKEVFHVVLTLSGDELTHQQLDAAMLEMDGDGSGKVEPKEFSAWWRNKTAGEDDSTEQELEDLFSEVDEDGSGKVDWEEFLTMICMKMEMIIDDRPGAHAAMPGLACVCAAPRY